MREEYSIYRANQNIPVFLRINPKNNSLIMVKKKFIKHGKEGPYDWIMDFSYSQEFNKEVILYKERIRKNTENLRYLGFNDKELVQNMSNIHKLINTTGCTHKNPADRAKYRKFLIPVYEKLYYELLKKTNIKNALLFSPKTGGNLVIKTYLKLGFLGVLNKNIIDYDVGRIVMKDGRLMVGLKNNGPKPNLKNYQVIIFADDCLSTSVTAFATFRWIKELAMKQNVNSKKIEIFIVVSVANQRAAQYLLDKKNLDFFDFKRLKIIAGIPNFQKADDFYMLDSDGKLLVGDMGRWIAE